MDRFAVLYKTAHKSWFTIFYHTMKIFINHFKDVQVQEMDKTVLGRPETSNFSIRWDGLPSYNIYLDIEHEYRMKKFYWIYLPHEIKIL